MKVYTFEIPQKVDVTVDDDKNVYEAMKQLKKMYPSIKESDIRRIFKNNHQIRIQR